MQANFLSSRDGFDLQSKQEEEKNIYEEKKYYFGEKRHPNFIEYIFVGIHVKRRTSKSVNK